MKHTSWLALLLVSTLLIALGGASNRLDSVNAATAAATQPGLGTPGAVEAVKIKASDGLEIVGAYYPSALSGRRSPAALLLHQFGGSKAEWKPLIPALAAEGYSILAVDQRGFGETGGTADWKLAETDIVAMLAWLRTQPAINGDQVAIIGASIGSNLALRGCANDDKCRAVVALSPGLDYFGVKTEDAVKKMTNKAVLLMAAQLDKDAAQGVKALSMAAPGDAMTRLYGASAKHGVAMFDYDDAIPTIMQWLRTYNGH